MRQRRRDIHLFFKNGILWFVSVVCSRIGQSSFISSVHTRKTRASLLSHKMTSKAASKVSNDATMIVIFGRAGAGKTTVADAAIDLLARQDDSIHCIGLDLDVCVPQWMRDNFGKGIYPTLKERGEFANNACDYVEGKLLEQFDTIEKGRPLVAIVSFSFVNTDLRDVFRSRFPNAVWALVDTSQSDADDRIQTRKGHYYKGVPAASNAEPSNRKTTDAKPSEEKSDRDNSEWDFAPVTFPHTVLPGSEPVASNARVVVDKLLEEIKRR